MKAVRVAILILFLLPLASVASAEDVAFRLNFKPAIGLKDGLRLTLERDPRFKG